MEISKFDSNMPFMPINPTEELREDEYIGKIVSGPFVNFNLFDSGLYGGLYVIIFGRTTRLNKDYFEHV